MSVVPSSTNADKDREDCVCVKKRGREGGREGGRQGGREGRNECERGRVSM